MRDQSNVRRTSSMVALLDMMNVINRRVRRHLDASSQRLLKQAAACVTDAREGDNWDEATVKDLVAQARDKASIQRNSVEITLILELLRIYSLLREPISESVAANVVSRLFEVVDRRIATSEHELCAGTKVWQDGDQETKVQMEYDRGKKRGLREEADLADQTIGKRRPVTVGSVRANMRRAVEASGFTLTEIGIGMGFSPSAAQPAVSRLIRLDLDYNPRVDSIIALATALGLPPKTFFE